MVHTPESVRAELAGAFADRRRPDDDHIAYSRPGCSGYEGDEARAWLRGTDWRAIMATGVHDRDLLAFLTLEGWLYYFPAFATIALDLDHPGDLANTLVHRLWSDPETISPLLAPRERRAIVHWLEYVAAAEEARGVSPNDARRALDDYWAYFTPPELFGDEETASAGLQEKDDVLS